MSENVKRSRSESSLKDEEKYMTESIQKKFKKNESLHDDHPHGNIFEVVSSCFQDKEILKNFEDLYPMDETPETKAILIELRPYKEKYSKKPYYMLIMEENLKKNFSSNVEGIIVYSTGVIWKTISEDK